jgi:hypothetical protein
MEAEDFVRDLQTHLLQDGDWESVRSVHTFAEAYVLTTNDGLVVWIDDGTQFQITVVRSRAPKDESDE